MGENANKVGAVLVTGGSVAGIQASLDLAELGYYVYLLEESSTLGGKIVPLDQNSSADDWTACFLSCKLNEVAEHASIKTITDGKLLDVAGEPGRLKVTVLKKSFENIPRPASPEAPETGNQNHPAASLELEVGAIVLADRVDLDPQARPLGVYGMAENRTLNSVFDPVATSRPGVYACRTTIRESGDLSYSIMEGSAAAGAASSGLVDARFTAARPTQHPEAPDRSAEPPRVGVFVCDRGRDTPALADYASELPFVEYSHCGPLACSAGFQAKVLESVREYRLNRVVVACSLSGSQAPIFWNTLLKAGLDQSLLQVVHLREEDSDPSRTAAAIQETRELIQKAVLRLALFQPFTLSSEGVIQVALVVGAGMNGMASAIAVAGQGYQVHLVEKTDRLERGPVNVSPEGDQDCTKLLPNLVDKIQTDPRIKVYLNSEVLRSSGYLGNFLTTVKTSSGEVTLAHGAAVLAAEGMDKRVSEVFRIEPSGVESSQEARPKMHPVECSREGVFLASPRGVPDFVPKTLVAGIAAGVRASVLLAKERVMVGGIAPVVSRGDCAACLTCVRVCPCGVPYVGEKGYSEIDPAICKGCGTCMAECPGGAISLQQHTSEEILARLEMSRCSACGQPYVTLARIQYLKRKLPAEDLQALWQGLCPMCARRKGAEDQAAGFLAAE